MTGGLRAGRTLRGWRNELRRELRRSDALPLAVMLLAAVACIIVSSVWPDFISYSVMLLPMIIGSLWLGPRVFPWFVVSCLVGVLIMLAVEQDLNARGVVRLAVTFGVGLVLVVSSFRRAGLGISAPRSESMFVDLRDRIAKQGVLPRLPDGWLVESAARSAGGTAFGGDFLVASRGDGGVVDVALVDVSGKGVDAGTRALLLSGAFGGLISALPPDQFLPAASSFLLRQDWDEGFATAIHLHLDTNTGEFELRKAGHPPAIWLQAGSGKWWVLGSEGPVLGLIPDADFEVVRGTLQPGDGLLLYTDGLVESPRRDIASGIDKLAGLGVRLFQTGFDGGATRVLRGIGRVNDDLALLMVHRR